MDPQDTKVLDGGKLCQAVPLQINFVLARGFCFTGRFQAEGL